jgi:hypothetical protein
MKTAFILLLVALMILPAVITVRLRLARVRREMAREREAKQGEGRT